MADVKQPPITHDEAIAVVAKMQADQFEKQDHAERLAILKRKSTCGHAGNNPLFGLYDPKVEFTLAELKILVPLDRDRMNYDWTNEAKKTAGKFARNIHGFLSVPKQKGKRKPHMNLHQQALKSESLCVFTALLETHIEKFKAVCLEKGLEYTGVPNEVIPAIGQQAARIAVHNVNARDAAKRRKARCVQQHSRRVNASLPVTSQKNFINRGGQYGN